MPVCFVLASINSSEDSLHIQPVRVVLPYNSFLHHTNMLALTDSVQPASSQTIPIHLS